jgi:hypothetical protein
VSDVPDGGVAQTSAYLRMLLLRPGDYRSRWERHTARPDPGLIDVPAIAKVLAETGTTTRPVELDETVRHALDGTLLNADVLRLFIDAFALDGRDA